MSVFLDHYKALHHSQKIVFDPAQHAVAESLSVLYEALHRVSWFSRRFIKPFSSVFSSPSLKGAYIFGDVGRGKTFLMDLFFSRTSVPKLRLHFHAFMQRIHEGRYCPEEGRYLPLHDVVKRICEGVALLCLDEVEVKDIADAMIIAEVLGFLFKRNTMIIATSNRPPQDLYKNGLHRERFMKTIELISSHLQVLNLNAKEDYRLYKKALCAHYLFPLSEATEESFQVIFGYLSKGSSISPLRVESWGRVVSFSCFSEGVLWACFSELCERPLSTADYLALCRDVRYLLLDNVSAFVDWDRDLWRRFMWLIDVLYDQRVQLFMRTQEPISLLLDYQNEWSFELQRTYSRLIEMQSWS